MTSPYLERPCRPLEEAKRDIEAAEKTAREWADREFERERHHRNWGVPPPNYQPGKAIGANGKDYRLGIAVTVAVSCAGWFAIFALAWAIVRLYSTL